MPNDENLTKTDPTRRPENGRNAQVGSRSPSPDQSDPSSSHRIATEPPDPVAATLAEFSKLDGDERVKVIRAIEREMGRSIQAPSVPCCDLNPADAARLLDLWRHLTESDRATFIHGIMAVVNNRKNAVDILARLAPELQERPDVLSFRDDQEVGGQPDAFDEISQLFAGIAPNTGPNRRRIHVSIAHESQDGWFDDIASIDLQLADSQLVELGRKIADACEHAVRPSARVQDTPIASGSTAEPFDKFAIHVMPWSNGGNRGDDLYFGTFATRPSVARDIAKRVERMVLESDHVPIHPDDDSKMRDEDAFLNRVDVIDVVYRTRLGNQLDARTIRVRPGTRDHVFRDARNGIAKCLDAIDLEGGA